MQPGMMKANDDRPRSARSRLNDDATKPLMTGTTNRVNQQAPYGEWTEHAIDFPMLKVGQFHPVCKIPVQF